MKKVLVIGPGKQGKKYIQYFTNQGYIIDTVSKTGNHQEKEIRKDISYTTFLQANIKLLLEYKYIIVSVAPLSEQEKVIRHLLMLNIPTITIIEKPIAVSKDVIEQVCDKDNMYLFIDELMLNNIYPDGDYSSAHIFAYNFDVFDHAIGTFLKNTDFQSLDIKISESQKYKGDLNYKIYIDNSTLECRKGSYYRNDEFFYKINFEASLNYILKLKNSESKIIKHNFLFYLKKFY